MIFHHLVDVWDLRQLDQGCTLIKHHCHTDLALSTSSSMPW